MSRPVLRAATGEVPVADSPHDRRRFKRPSAFPKVLLHTLRDPVHLRATHLIRAVMVMGESHSDVSVGPVDMSSRISMRRIISSLFGCPKSDRWWWLASRCLFSWRCCLPQTHRRFDFRNLILLFALRRLDWGELVAEVEKIRAAKVSSPAFACASRLAYDRGAWS